MALTWLYCACIILFMDLISEARAILRAADRELRGLMEKAVQAGRYSDVARLVEIAKAINHVASEWTGEGLVINSELADVCNAPALTSRVSSPRAASKAKVQASNASYPKFERDENRLVKIGWSKREKAEYEHKAPRDAAFAVYSRLCRVPAATTFRMEELLPIALPDGTEVPSYQSYLVLAWLRDINQIEKRANDSYQWVVEEIDLSAFEEVWKRTPNRSIPMKARGK
jgi:hypothetical protein